MYRMYCFNSAIIMIIVYVLLIITSVTVTRLVGWANTDGCGFIVEETTYNYV